MIRYKQMRGLWICETCDETYEQSMEDMEREIVPKCKNQECIMSEKGANDG